MAVKVSGLPVNEPEVAVNVLVPGAAPSVHVPAPAIPEAFVVWVAVFAIDPPPAVTAKVTLTPLTGLLLASLTVTLGTVPVAVPDIALWLFPAFTTIWVAVPAVPIAVKVTGLPEKPAEVAVKVFIPEVVPRVQLPMVATPPASVVAARPVAEPPPVATAKVTLTPLTGLLLRSFTITLGGVTDAPAIAFWLLPVFTAICVAFPTTVVIVAVVPIRLLPSVAVTVVEVPATV